MIRLLLLVFAIFLTIFSAAQVYQLPNGGFENWDGGSNNEPKNWNAFPSAICDLSFPASAGCSSAKAKRHDKSTDVRPGSDGKYSCKIYATEIKILGKTIVANGIITTGQVRIGSATASSSENYNITRISNSEYRQALNAMPDSIRFWAKFKCPSSSQQARMNAVIHDSYGYRDPSNSDGNAYKHVVAKAVLNFNRGDQGWKQYSVPFSYNYPATVPRYILLTFTTNKEAGKGSKNDILYIDDVEFVYNTRLQSIKIANKAIPGFSPDVKNYDFDLDCTPLNEVVVVANTQSVNADYSVKREFNKVTITVTAGNQTDEYVINLLNYGSDRFKVIRDPENGGLNEEDRGMISLSNSILGEEYWTTCKNEQFTNIILGTGNEIVVGTGYPVGDYEIWSKNDLGCIIRHGSTYFVEMDRVEIKNYDSEFKISVYPNPTTGNITVDVGEILECLDLIIYDQTGKQIEVIRSCGNREINVKITGLPGLYYLDVINENGSKLGFKIIKTE